MERNTRAGNFDALWRTLDERYCFFVEKGEAYGLDWNEVYARYRPAVTEQMNAYQLFDVMGRMLAELRDGHVNLYAPHDVARYGAWFDDFPANFNDSLARRYLGRTDEYRTTAGMQYRVLDADRNEIDLKEEKDLDKSSTVKTKTKAKTRTA